MRDAHHILFDNWPGIQFRSNIVTGSANNLYATLKCRMIGFRTYKCRKERVVYIDNTVGISIYHLLGNNLHITRQHYEVHFMLGKQFHFFLFLFLLCLLSNRKKMERYAKTLRYMLQVGMITYYKRYFYIPLPCRIARQQIKEAMRHFRHKDSHTRFGI